MQSILQYRQFRKSVEEQHGLAKSRIAESRITSSDRHGGDTSVSSDTAVDRDVEKSHAQSDDTNGSNTPAHPTEEVEMPSKEDAQSPHDDHEQAEQKQEDNHQLQQHSTRLSQVKSNGTGLVKSMTGVEMRKRTTNDGGDGNVYIVNFRDDDDPLNPHNWSKLKRMRITLLVASIAFIVGWASSIDSLAIKQAAAEFGVSEVVEAGATGLFLIGFGIGALISAPLSETVGRNPVYIATLILYMIFIMASALAPNIGAQYAFRFLAGVFGGSPLVLAGGSIADTSDPFERTYAFPIFANAGFLGPVSGAFFSGFIAEPTSAFPSWRWTEWMTLIISGVIFVLVVLFLPETLSPVLLKWKAKHLRDVTGDDRYRAEVEVRTESFLSRLRHALYRPILLTVTEPIIAFIALYMTVIYIILFTFLDGYVYIFQNPYGLSSGVTGACFGGIILGLFGASALVPFIVRKAKRELHTIQSNGGSKLPPEFRLLYAMIGAPFIPISLFWMGWTSNPSISIWSPLAASVPFGFGILCVFISSYQYIIDGYEQFAASALASITLIRYVAAGGMTIAGVPFYENLGVHYTLTILACISLACTPLPYIFYKYGHALRKRSKYAPTD